MSYFEIGIFHSKTEVNIGTLWRSAYQLGASSIFTIGRRYKHQSSDVYKTKNNIPLYHYLTIDDFLLHRPNGALLIGIEMGGIPLSKFTHPKQAIYLLGSEDKGLPESVIKLCNNIVSLESVVLPSYNVAVAGSIVLYDRVFTNKLEVGK